MNKNALIIGGGSKYGLKLTNNLLEKNYNVNCLSGTALQYNKNLNSFHCNWNSLKISDLEKWLKNLGPQCLIFFNQNSSALSKTCYTNNSFNTLQLWKQEKDWSQSYFISCILPFHVIHTLGKFCDENTKIAWMLSSLVVKHDVIQQQYADYIGNKMLNYLVMKNFSQNHRSSFFGINPDNINESGTDSNVKNFLEFVINADALHLNGKIFKLNCSEDTTFYQLHHE